jgi:PIN domain nuclease of toxin-antitoxin system
MSYLLDTHTFIWAVLETTNLGIKGKEIIFNKKNEIFVSTISFWEISLKASQKKFSFGNIKVRDFPQYARDMDFTVMDMKENESITFHELPLKKNHSDPFDRMLIWQAITSDLTMISKDRLFEQYKEDGLRIIW